MGIVELLIALEEEGFPQVLACEGDIVVFGNKPNVPVDLAHQLRLNKPELLPMLRKISRATMEAMAAGKIQRPPVA